MPTAQPDHAVTETPRQATAKPRTASSSALPLRRSGSAPPACRQPYRSRGRGRLPRAPGSGTILANASELQHGLFVLFSRIGYPTSAPTRQRQSVVVHPRPRNARDWQNARLGMIPVLCTVMRGVEIKKLRRQDIDLLRTHLTAKRNKTEQGCVRLRSMRVPTARSRNSGSAQRLARARNLSTAFSEPANIGILTQIGP
jgi:hypothetical protein